MFFLSVVAHAGGLKICLLFVVLILVCLWFTKKRKAYPPNEVSIAKQCR